MNIDAHGPVGLWLSENKMLDPMKARIEMIMNKGLQIIVPDFIMPKFEWEPFTENELRQYGFKIVYPNISRLRSIIRKHKQKIRI